MKTYLFTIKNGKADRKHIAYGKLDEVNPDGTTNIIVSATAEYVIDEILAGRFDDGTITIKRTTA